MPWDNVPWAVHGGVKHSASIARLLGYAAFGGQEGVIAARDLEVKALTTPGASVQVMPGGVAILNRSAAGTYEAYVGRLRTAETVTIGATGAAPRTDLVIARVEDPFEEPGKWSAPTQAAIDDGSAQFIFTRVLTGVDKTVNPRTIIANAGYTAIPLAFVDLPANTATVTTARIIDLRRLPSPRRSDAMYVATMTTANARNLTSSTFANWPSELSTSVDVPPWATHAMIRAILGGVAFGAAGNNGGSGWSAAGLLRLSIGSIDGDSTAYNVSTDSGVDRTTLLSATPKVAIPTTMRGTSVTVKLQGTKASGSANLQANAGTTATLEVVFMEAPESSG